MDKKTEELLKERLVIHPKCRGEGFSEEEVKFLRAGHCSRIDPAEVFDIIDEDSGKVDPEAKPSKSFIEDSCRCTSYVNPGYWWRPGWRCPLGDHYRPDLFVKSEKSRVGQQKQKKKK